ncbi:hypothetical protein DRE_03450 [Drechslerella stenobrocha 248]|uniref:Uncharacterized protein n=1 Tax=Drechslerella stenobrocha 248 TaxID=1043628 RepID=W7HSQ5_9PEZI|nr:hypothetical protein DRE_03450 [Drechslerella stenobrocha 248]
MSYPYYRPDHNDPRYYSQPQGHSYGHGNANGGEAQSYHYAPSLDISDSLSDNHDYQAYHQHSHPDTSMVGIPSYGNGYLQESYHSGASSSSGHPSSSTGYRSRGISTEYTNPDTEFQTFVQTGQRCIFHWKSCPERHSSYNDWKMHADGHLPDPSSRGPQQHRRDFKGMPTSWTCGFPHCRVFIREDDHQELWERKLGHIFEHLKSSKPEDNREDINWMEYYLKLRLCNEEDVQSFTLYPPSHAPFLQGVTEPRHQKDKKKGKKDSRLTPEPPIGPAATGHGQQCPPITANLAPPHGQPVAYQPDLYIYPLPASTYPASGVQYDSSVQNPYPAGHIYLAHNQPAQYSSAGYSPGL